MVRFFPLLFLVIRATNNAPDEKSSGEKLWENLRETPGFLYKNEVASSMTIFVIFARRRKLWAGFSSDWRTEKLVW